MLPISVKLLVALTCVTAVYLTTEAADTCPVTTVSCLPGLPGRDGKDGQPGRDGQSGRDGRDGPPGPPGGPKGENGMNGRDGEPGEVGPQGIPGMNGTDGEQGPVGPIGPQGPVGPQRPDGVVPDAVIEQLRDEILKEVRRELKLICPGDREMYPATSCKEIHGCNPTALSEYYWVNTTTGPLQVYCQMDTNDCGNITGGWTRVAHINMSEPQQTCPSPLLTLNAPVRMCTGGASAGCYSVLHPALGLSFTQVCGQAIGYMYASVDGLDAIFTTKVIDNPYVDGLSITYSSPRQHLWTYAAGYDGRCLCHSSSFASPPPSFVGQHFYCDGWSKQNSTTESPHGLWYTQYPLWDGEGCPDGNTCCDPPNLPWFHRTLNTASTDDIEVHWCRDQPTNDEDFGVDLLELYVY